MATRQIGIGDKIEELHNDVEDLKLKMKFVLDELTTIRKSREEQLKEKNTEESRCEGLNEMDTIERMRHGDLQKNIDILLDALKVYDDFIEGYELQDMLDEYLDGLQKEDDEEECGCDYCNCGCYKDCYNEDNEDSSIEFELDINTGNEEVDNILMRELMDNLAKQGYEISTVKATDTGFEMIFEKEED